MIIVNVEYPGTWLELPDKDKAFLVSNIITSMETAIIDLAISLTMFNESVMKGREERDSENMEERWNRSSELRNNIENEYKNNLNNPNDFYENHELHRVQVEKIFRDKILKTGVVPDSYKHRFVFIHAHSFLSSADTFSKYLSVVSDETSMEFVAELLKELDDGLPSLRKIRNSSEHSEDRSRGYGKPADVRKKQKMDLKPIDNNLIRAKNGGVLVMSSLNGDKLGYTVDDGTYQEIEINMNTLGFITNIFQRLINGFEWKGPVRINPHV